MALPSWITDIGSAASSFTSGLGLLQGLGSLFGIGTGPSYEEQMAAQWEYAQKAMMLQYNNQLGLQQNAQKYNTALLKMQQDYQSAEWLKQFNTQARYNSPEAMMNRLRAAGLNPSALIGGNIPATAASTMGAQASAPTAPSAGLGSAAIQGVTPSYYDFTVKRREGLLALQNIARTAKELGYTDERMRAEIDSVWAKIGETNSNERLNDIIRLNHDFDLKMKKTYGHADWKARLSNMNAQTYLALSSGDEKMALTQLHALEQMVKSKEFEKLSKEIEFLPAIYGQQINLLKAQTAANYASAEQSHEAAGLAHEQALTEDALRGYKDIIMDAEAYKAYTLQDSQIEVARKAIETSKVLSDAEKQDGLKRLRRLEDENRVNGDGLARAFDSWSEWALNKADKVHLPFVFTKSK